MKGILKLGLVMTMGLTLISCVKEPPPSYWRCTSTDLHHNHWVKHAPTRIEASAKAMDACEQGVYRSTCRVKCLPPAVRWHCVSVDKGGHTWYWNSTSLKVAVRNAKADCLKNTTLGGCRVPRANCSMT